VDVSLSGSTATSRGPEDGGRFRLTSVSFAAPHSDQLIAPGSALDGIVPLKRSATGEASLRLDDLIGLLERRMERPLFVWLKSSESASKYVTLDTLRRAGICVDFDPILNHVDLSVPGAEECHGAR
jgi:hypothetical protein